MKRTSFRRPGLILVTVFVLFFAACETARAEAIHSEEFRDRLAASIRRLGSDRGPIDSRDTTYLKGLFPPGLTVVSPDGEAVPVDRRGLLQWIDRARGSERGRAQLAEYLSSLSRHSNWGGGRFSEVGAGWEAGRSRLEEVLASGEFSHLREKKPPPWTVLLDRVLEKIGEWLKRHSGALGYLTGPRTEYVLYGFLLLLCVFLMIRVLHRLGPVGWRWRGGGVRTPAGLSGRREKDWTLWREEAGELAAKGAFRDAIRALFVSVLLEGHQRGWWIYEPEKTNREHLTRMEGPRERREALGVLTDLYERAWYGLGSPGAEAFRACQDCLRRMEAVP